jgi:hypothetical protein
MVGLGSNFFDPEPQSPVPYGHGEPDYLPGLFGRGSNVQDPWAFDPTPIPATPTKEVDFS